uniref:Uncharacterized protein n=1 Tax=Brassica oleracea var. oleracea TaxID=109376 RepID=A0A0D2ZX90_BRAOL
MMIRPDLDSVVVVVVRGTSLGIPVIHLPTAPTIHLPTAPASAPLALAAAPAPAPADPPGVMSVAELRMDQPYDVLGPRQGTSDFRLLSYRLAGYVVSSVCVMDNYGKQIHEWKKKWEINK